MARGGGTGGGRRGAGLARRGMEAGGGREMVEVDGAQRPFMNVRGRVCFFASHDNVWGWDFRVWGRGGSGLSESYMALALPGQVYGGVGGRDGGSKLV
jgi:hypothetical protein